jgi:hypothetical protein
MGLYSYPPTHRRIWLPTVAHLCQAFSLKESLSKRKKVVVKIQDLAYLKTMKNELNKLNEGQFNSKGEYYHFVRENNLEQELDNLQVVKDAYNAGYDNEKFDNPFSVNSLGFWAVNCSYDSGASDC